MKRTPPPRIIHTCPTCNRLSSLAPDAEKICLTCGCEAVEVGNELPFDMEGTHYAETINEIENRVIGMDYYETKDAAEQYNEKNPVIFVYQKDGTTKALSFQEAKEQATKIEADGWAHVATLDAKVFVEHHYNNR